MASDSDPSHASGPSGELFITDEQRTAAQLELKERFGAVIPDDLVAEGTRWLVKKWGSGKTAPACAYCRATEWLVSDRIMALSSWGLPEVRPVLSVTCANCGHLVLIDATNAGLVQRIDDEVKP